MILEEDHIMAQPDERALAQRRAAQTSRSRKDTGHCPYRRYKDQMLKETRIKAGHLTAVLFPSHLWLTGPGPRPLPPDSPGEQPARGQNDLSSSHKQGDNQVLTHSKTLGNLFLLWA